MSRKTLGWIFGIAVVAIAAIVAVASPKPGLSYQDDMLKAGTAVATALFVVALFVERSTGVIYALIFGEGERNAHLALTLATDGKARKDDARTLADELGFKERFRILLGFGTGLFVSIAGVRTLAGLVKLDAPTGFATACGQTGGTEACRQAVLELVTSARLFNVVDVLLTAGLVAGGSNGIAFIIRALKEMMSKPNGDKDAEIRIRSTTTS
jgi:hypothetical protein